MPPVTGTIPYPWPYDADADADSGPGPDRYALLLTGVQRQWSSLGADGGLDRIEAFTATLRALGVLVVTVRHGRPAGIASRARGLPIVGTREWELVLPPEPTDLVVDTTGYDGFAAGWLDRELRAHERDHLLLAGLGAELFLDTTLRSANDRGYECLTLTDLAVPFDAALGARVLDSVTMSGGIFGALGTSGAVLDALRPTTEVALSGHS